MRAIHTIIFAAAATFSTAAMAQDEGPVADEPMGAEIDMRQMIDDLAATAGQLKARATIMRRQGPGEVGCEFECVAAYFDAMSVAGMARAMQIDAPDARPPELVQYAEAIAYQAAFTYDSFAQADVAEESHLVCRSMQDSVRAANQAMDIARAICASGTESKVCQDMAASPMVENPMEPECEAAPMQGPNDIRRFD